MRKVITMASPEELYQCGTRCCNYIYDPEWADKERGILSGTKFEDLPEDWRCPYCGASKEKFRRLREPKPREEPAPDSSSSSLTKNRPTKGMFRLKS